MLLCDLSVFLTQVLYIEHHLRTAPMLVEMSGFHLTLVFVAAVLVTLLRLQIVAGKQSAERRARKNADLRSWGA